MSQLPTGWHKVTLGEICSKPQYGFTTKSADNGRVKYLRTTDLTSGKINWFSVPFCIIEPGDDEKYQLNDNDIVISRAGSVGFHSLIKNPVRPAIFASYLIRFKPYIHPEYLSCFLNSKSYWDQLRDKSVGVAVQNVNAKKLSELIVPVAPLNEQVRIANKLDSLLAKVETAQSRLEKIPTLLKRFRQSVLAAATSGELTKDWREDNKKSMRWKGKVFADLSREITVGFVGKMKDKYQSAGVKFLRSQNVRALRFDSRNLLYISEDFHKQIFKSRLEEGDLAVVRSGAPGTACVIPPDLGDANCSDLVIVRPKHDEILSDFACIYMNSAVAQANVRKNQVGVAQQHFNVGSMKKMPIQLPSMAEQAEIVRRVESLFAKADAVEAQYQAAKQRLDKLTQSTLVKAFRGELVPQNPNDEPASELLKRIQAEREKQATASKPKRAKQAKK